jgi:hypothetical protein
MRGLCWDLGSVECLSSVYLHSPASHSCPPHTSMDSKPSGTAICSQAAHSKCSHLLSAEDIMGKYKQCTCCHSSTRKSSACRHKCKRAIKTSGTIQVPTKHQGTAGVQSSSGLLLLLPSQASLAPQDRALEDPLVGLDDRSDAASVISWGSDSGEGEGEHQDKHQKVHFYVIF